MRRSFSPLLAVNPRRSNAIGNASQARSTAQGGLSVISAVDRHLEGGGRGYDWLHGSTGTTLVLPRYGRERIPRYAVFP
jgi:hypothetical protein